MVELVARSGSAGDDDPADPHAVDSVLDGLLDYLEAHPHLPRLIQRAALDDVGHLRALLGRVLRPLYAQGLRVLEATPWERAELPHVAAGIFHLIFGYFSGTALLELVVEEDPASRAALARQRTFLKRAIAELLGLAPVRRVARNARRRR
jgi:AcrR family transcriptional regulator